MRLHFRAFVVFAAVALLVTTTTARGVPPPQAPSSAFRSAVNLIALNVSVQDAQSRYVTDLQASDFAVFDDGVRRDVRVFDAAKMPVDLVLLLDVSQSMSVRMTLARTAAQGILDTLRGGDRGAVMLFNQHVQAMAGLSGDRAALAAVVDAAKPNGDTALHSAVYIALRQFGHVACDDTEIRRQALVVLSDGEDNASTVSFDEVVALARTIGMTIYTVRVEEKTNVINTAALSFPRQSSEADFEMRALARETGALSFFPVAEQLPAVYGAIAQELASQYSVAYDAPPGPADGRFHQITVRILNHPDLRARTRLGYTAARDAHLP